MRARERIPGRERRWGAERTRETWVGARRRREREAGRGRVGGKEKGKRKERGENPGTQGTQKVHATTVSTAQEEKERARVRASGVKKPFSLESLHRDSTMCVCVSAVCRIPYTCVCGWVSLSQTERWSEGGRVGGREGRRVSGREGVWVG